MSGTLVRRVGIFVAPSYVTVTPGGADGDRFQTNPIDEWVATEANAPKVAVATYVSPPLENFVFDEYGNVIGGGQPVVGAMLAIVTAQAETGSAAELILQEIDALPDVRRYVPSHQENAWQTIQTWLRGKGLTSIHLLDGQTAGVEELARRTAALIDPAFSGFQPGTFG